MTFLESVFTTLEKVDNNVRKAVGVLRRDSGPTAPQGEPMSTSGTKAGAAIKPLGNPAVAVQVYGRAIDPWTGRTTRLLKDRSIAFEFVELDATGNERLTPRLETETKQRITPYVYIRGEFVGGFNALDEIERLGQLDEMIKTPEERAQSPHQGVKIVIAKRGAEEAPPGEH